MKIEILSFISLINLHLFFIIVEFLLSVFLGFEESSKDFAYELFDVLSKRKKIKFEDGITRQQLKEFWDELKKDDLETRLDIFFDL